MDKIEKADLDLEFLRFFFLSKNYRYLRNYNRRKAYLRQSLFLMKTNASVK